MPSAVVTLSTRSPSGVSSWTKPPAGASAPPVSPFAIRCLPVHLCARGRDCLSARRTAGSPRLTLVRLPRGVSARVGAPPGSDGPHLAPLESAEDNGGGDVVFILTENVSVVTGRLDHSRE